MLTRSTIPFLLPICVLHDWQDLSDRHNRFGAPQAAQITERFSLAGTDLGSDPLSFTAPVESICSVTDLLSQTLVDAASFLSPHGVHETCFLDFTQPEFCTINEVRRGCKPGMRWTFCSTNLAMSSILTVQAEFLISRWRRNSGLRCGVGREFGRGLLLQVVFAIPGDKGRHADRDRR